MKQSVCQCDQRFFRLQLMESHCELPSFTMNLVLIVLRRYSSSWVWSSSLGMCLHRRSTAHSASTTVDRTSSEWSSFPPSCCTLSAWYDFLISYQRVWSVWRVIVKFWYLNRFVNLYFRDANETIAINRRVNSAPLPHFHFLTKSRYHYDIDWLTWPLLPLKCRIRGNWPILCNVIRTGLCFFFIVRLDAGFKPIFTLVKKPEEKMVKNGNDFIANT